MTREPLPTVDFPFTSSPSAVDDPAGLALLEHAEVVRARLPHGTEIWAALSHATARQVLTDPRFSRVAALAPGAPQVAPGLAIPHMLTSMDEPEHGPTRRLVMRAFTPRLVEAMRPWIEDIVTDLLDQLVAAGRPAEFTTHFTDPLPIRVITRLLGVPYEDQARFRDWTSMLLSDSQADFEQVMSAIGALQAYLAELVAAKRGRDSGDLIGVLLRAREDGERLTEEELLSNVLLVLVAGYDTTLNQLPNGLACLLTERSRWEDLVARPERVLDVVDELLRYIRLTPMGTLIRIATEDVELGGRQIRAGEGVVPMQHIANRDPAVFPEPDRFDPQRTNLSAHLSFGAGPHRCAGAQLARLEMTVALEQLVRRMPGLRLAVPAAELTWKVGVVVRGPATLPITW